MQHDVGMRITPRALALLATLVAMPAGAESASSSFTVSLRVLPRVRSGLPGNARAALVSTSSLDAALPCGAEGSASCEAAVAHALASGKPVVLSLLPDGSPTAIVER